MQRSPAFDFYEKVVVNTAEANYGEINGKLAAVLGRVEDDHGHWSYAIHIYGEVETWSVPEDALQSTGEFDSRETFYDGSSIRVSKDGEILG